MKTSARIGFIFVIGLFLAACTPQATALSTPIPMTTLTPTVSSTPLPTATPTITPEPSPTPLPAYAEWMQPYVEGLVPVAENGVTYLAKNLAFGRQIKMFEYVDNEWRPSYVDMDKFVGGKKFQLEMAMQTMFMRMGPVADVDGQPAMSVNMEDYQRFTKQTQQIFNRLDNTRLFRTCFTSMPVSGQFYGLSGYKLFDMTILDDEYENPYFDSGQWQLIGWAKNPVGAESVFVLATADGPVALLNVGDVGYLYNYSPSDSIEEGVIELALQTSTQFGTSDVISLLLDLSINPRFKGTINTEKAELMRAYIRGMGIDGEEIAGMMFGPIEAQRNALKYMFEHFPAPIYDFNGD